MGLHLRNTLSAEVEAFEPLGDEVTLYYCGLTVSDEPHLGHARSWVHVDVLRRWLEFNGYDVIHVENFTDVNEKIVARIGERADWDSEGAVGEYFIDRTLDAQRALNLRRASAYPRVTEHIDEIIDLTERLIDAGYAYESNGSVYFDVPAFEGYGQLIDPDIDDADDDHPDKRHPADFALWKADGVDPEDIGEHVKDPDIDLEAACAGALTWDSPWGEGRPGWHIECSAMSMAHLGETFDIHVAGHDIIFPHNENEIAQSEAASGEDYARYWVHMDLLEMEGDKMSSSLENFLTVDAALERYGPNVIRVFLLSANHGTRQSYSTDAIDQATRRWDGLDRAYTRVTEALDSPDTSPKVTDDTLREAVTEATVSATQSLDDNLGTRGALVALESVADAVTGHIEAGDPPYDYAGLLEALETFEAIGTDVLGLTFGQRETTHRLDTIVQRLLAHRESLRDDGAFEQADALRSALADAGVEIEDADDGPRYRLVETHRD